MIVITTPLGAVGLLVIAYLGLLFANFSRRLSAVTRMMDHYRWFQAACIFVVLAALSQMIRGTGALAPDLALPVLLEPWFALVSFHIPLAVGVTVDVWLVLYYWRWIVKESIK